MAFTAQEIESIVRDAAEGCFGGVSSEKAVGWVSYVCAVDEAPKDKHPLHFYAAVARVMAESLGSTEKEDFADPHMRNLVLEHVKAGTKPFQADLNETWKELVLTPAQVNLALRVQSKAQADGTTPGGPLAAGSSNDLATALASYASAQKAVAEKESKKGTLSFVLKDRLAEVGLTCLPKDMVPSEESLVKLEALARSARDHGRLFVGSSEGEDLMMHFRPFWSRTPKLDVLTGEGTFKEKLKSALDAKKARTTEEKVSFLGFATFMSHVQDWGLKMILTKVITITQFFAYSLVLVRLTEEYGGTKTTYHYDLLLRRKLARALEQGETDQIDSLLCSVDREVLADAKIKAAQRAEESAR